MAVGSSGDVPSRWTPHRLTPWLSSLPWHPPRAASGLCLYRTLTVKVREELDGKLSTLATEQGIDLLAMEWSAASEAGSELKVDGYPFLFSR